MSFETTFKSTKNFKVDLSEWVFDKESLSFWRVEAQERFDQFISELIEKRLEVIFSEDGISLRINPHLKIDGEIVLKADIEVNEFEAVCSAEWSIASLISRLKTWWDYETTDKRVLIRAIEAIEKELTLLRVHVEGY